MTEEALGDQTPENGADADGDAVGEPAAPPPYEFDPADVVTAAALVDDAFGDGSDSWSAAHRLATQAKELGLPSDGPLVRELVLAVSYSRHLQGLGRSGCSFGPTVPGATYQWPPPISSVSDDVVRLWDAVAQAVTAPAAIAQFEDLLFCRRHGIGRDRALRAAQAYLDLASSGPLTSDAVEAMDRTEALVRAWDLGRSVRLAEVDTEVRSRMAAHAADILGKTPGEAPGVVLPFLAALAEGPVQPKSAAPRAVEDPIDVDALLDLAARSFRKGYLASEVAGLRRGRTSDPERSDSISREEVAAYFAEAEDAPFAAVRMVHLESAAQVARDRGLTDLVRQASAEMQRIRPEDLGLQHVTASVEVPRYVPEGWLAPFVRFPDWRDGIEVFLAYPPPTGALRSLRQAEISMRSGLEGLFRSVMLNRHGLPRATTEDEEDRVARQIAFVAGVQAEEHGRLLAKALWRIEERYGVPDEDAMTVLLSRNGACDAQLARSLAKAFRHFWSGDFESCVHLALPKIEAAARSLLRELDEGVYRVQAGKTLGGYPGLGVLLAELKKIALDESWAYFLGWLLCDPYGLNIRNEVAHGFVTETKPGHAALVLRAAGLLVTVAGTPPFPAEGGVPQRTRQEVIDQLAAPNRSSASRWDDRVVGAISAGLGRLWWSVERRQAVRQARRGGRHRPSAPA